MKSFNFDLVIQYQMNTETNTVPLHVRSSSKETKIRFVENVVGEIIISRHYSICDNCFFSYS